MLIDGAGITKKAREKYTAFKQITSSKLVTVLIDCDLEEKLLLTRLHKRNDSNKDHKWVDLYNDIRKQNFEKITVDEADYILHFDQENYNQILSELKDIFSKANK